MKDEGDEDTAAECLFVDRPRSVSGTERSMWRARLFGLPKRWSSRHLALNANSVFQLCARLAAQAYSQDWPDPCRRYELPTMSALCFLLGLTIRPQDPTVTP